VKRILIVEDDRDLRFVIRMVVERAGYDVSEARHGVAALESIGAEPPDLVIADLTMPVMSGVELIDQIRSNPATASIPPSSCLAAGRSTRQQRIAWKRWS
jgi:CheY-like chemotaxis protein